MGKMKTAEQRGHRHSGKVQVLLEPRCDFQYPKLRKIKLWQRLQSVGRAVKPINTVEHPHIVYYYFT